MDERKIEQGPEERKTVMTALDSDEISPCLIHIDKEGHWYHKGREMIHRELIQLFYENMELDRKGRYVIQWSGERCYVEVEDTAFVIWQAALEDSGTTCSERITLRLSDFTQEELLPETLFVGKKEVLYCKVKDGRFPARFNRPAYYQLTQHIQEENGVFYLPLNGRKYSIIQGTDKAIRA
jgi:hypothetical protein